MIFEFPSCEHKIKMISFFLVIDLINFINRFMWLHQVVVIHFKKNQNSLSNNILYFHQSNHQKLTDSKVNNNFVKSDNLYLIIVIYVILFNLQKNIFSSIYHLISDFCKDKNHLEYFNHSWLFC